jgi:hypothetical protein
MFNLGGQLVGNFTPLSQTLNNENGQVKGSSETLCENSKKISIHQPKHRYPEGEND